MKKNWLQLIVILVIVLAPFCGISQENRSQLEERRKKLEAEISYTNKLIDATKKSKKTTVNELRLLGNRINQRNELIATLKKEIQLLDSRIESTEFGINRLSRELSELKKEYAQIVYFAYKHQTAYNKLTYLFSAEDMNQAYQRFRYLDQISKYIRDEAASIKKKEKIKESELDSFNEQIKQKKQLLDTENIQISKIEREITQKDEVMQDLSEKEKQLRADLRVKEKETRKLSKKIKDIIAREIKPKTSPTTGKTYALTPREIKLSESFATNKGKLPWPIERGIVSETFGVHQHPVLKNVKTRNNGIDIVTSENSNARSVFDGTVVSVTTITNTNKAVIIKHGSYFTVYSNLDEVSVTQGQEVDTRDFVGRVHTNMEGKTELHFEVWKGKEIQNPAFWILKR